jgi:hypothetical protein
VNETPTVGVARHLGDFDRLAGQRAGDINRPTRAFGNSIAAVAHPVDRELFSHARPR